MKKSPNPTFDQVSAWCDHHDNHAIQGWLTLLLDGTYSVDEMCAAVLADRSPETAKDLDAATDRLEKEVLRLPDYRGWYVERDYRDPEDMLEKIVWKHDDNDTKIWLDLIRKNKDQVDLSIDVADPNDGSNYPSGAYETLPEHTVAAVWAICKPILDENSFDDDDNAAPEAPKATP